MQKLKQKAIDIVEHAEPNLPIIGLFATVGYPLFYFVWTYVTPQPYENLWLRLAEAAISLPWLFYFQLPKKAKDYFPAYFFLSVPLLLPFFFHFMMIKNEWSVTWAMSSMACLFLLILIIYDWVLIFIITVIGFIMAYAAVYLLDGEIRYTYFQIEYIPTYLFAMVGGIIANHRKQIAHQTKISLLQSLSGSIAHEMRNPLSSITNAMTSLQTILPNRPQGNADRGSVDLSYSGLISMHDAIEESSETIRRGNKIIDSILASLQGGAVDNSNFKRLTAKNTIQSAVNTYGYDNTEDRKLIVVNTSHSFDFFGDKDLFIYVLFNLIKNALHYKNRPDFRIEITSETGPGINCITVKDYGPGVPSRMRERIFDRFYTYGKNSGNGLGLAFCRRVIESFGGRIVCNSEEGAWTEFRISLPGYDSKTVRELKKNILEHKKVLVVDDQIANRLLLGKYITEWNCPFDQAENGKQALDLLNANRYDLIFMDFEMPSLNGDCAVRRLRSARDFAPSLALHHLQTPVIGITALPQSEALERAAQCGMNGVLLKPVRRPDIKTVFERHFFSETSTSAAVQKEVLPGSRILLVDDNETSRKFMSMILAHYGCSVGQAENGLAAIEQLDQEDYDLVLMDMEMPVMDGMETARTIRKGEVFSRFRNFSTIPIIALTGNTDNESIRRTREAGMNHHLGKPVFRNELVTALGIWLKNGGTEPSREQKPVRQQNETEKLNIWNHIGNEKLLDRSILNSIRDTGGPMLIEDIFEVFIRDTGRIIEELAVTKTTGNLKRYDQLIHTLKGSSGSCGANRLYVLACHINEFSRKGRWPDHAEWHTVLKQTLEETSKALRVMLQTGTFT